MDSMKRHGSRHVPHPRDVPVTRLPRGAVTALYFKGRGDLPLVSYGVTAVLYDLG